MAQSLTPSAQGSCPSSHQAVWEVDAATNMPSTSPRSVSDISLWGR